MLVRVEVFDGVVDEVVQRRAVRVAETHDVESHLAGDVEDLEIRFGRTAAADEVHVEHAALLDRGIDDGRMGLEVDGDLGVGLPQDR